MYPTTPDARYFVVKETLWRCANPDLDEADKARLVKELMAARRAVKTAKSIGDEGMLADARQRVNSAKVSLGERGPVWWTDGAPDFNRHKVGNTPYASWYQSVVSG
jgi:hypothetical protein